MKSFAVAAAAGSAHASLWTASERKYWTDVGRAAGGDTVEFTVGMAMRDFPALHKTLMDISDPTSVNYGKWLTQGEADALSNTPASVVDEVAGWATSTGAQCVQRETWLRCRASVSATEKLLDAELRTYAMVNTDRRVIRTSVDRPGVVPEHLTDKVTVVTGLSQLPLPSMRLGTRRPLSVTAGAADYSIVPQTLYTLYGVTDRGAAASSVGPIEFQGSPAPVYTDQDTFVKNVGLKNWTLPAKNIVGPYAPGPGAVESTLDEQYIAAVGPDSTQWYWTEGNWQYEFASTISTAKDFPSVMSMSYAWYEGGQCTISPSVAPCDNKQTYAASVAFVKAVNPLFAKAVAKGITLLSASGDSGAHGRSDGTCQFKYTRAEFPASSPYVTAVGATELQDGKTGPVAGAPICASTLHCATGGYEVVASNAPGCSALFDSGGGFSNITLRAAEAAWQDAAVAHYITNASAVPEKGDFNPLGRGVPDVSALGHNYYVEIQGPQAVDGTSAATPVWGGIIGNLNAWRLANGKPVLGFVNPLLYKVAASTPAAFTDVVQGNNKCSEDGCTTKCTGYEAAPGWDATTGLGTPNYAALKEGIAAVLQGK